MLTGGCGRPHPPFSFLGTLSRSRAPWLLAVGLLAGSPLFASPPAEDLAAKAQRGKEAMAAGRFDQAAAVYAEIVQLLPSEPGMLLNLGMALSMAGRPREAIPHLEAALKLRPDLIPASLFLGSAHLELGQASRAVEPLQKVVAAQPDNRDARQMLADALLSLQRYEPATRHFRKLSELAPREPRAWYGLGRGYEGLAREAFEGLQRSAPDSPFLLLLVAEAMAAQGKGANAFRLYREALEKRPGLPEAHEAVARIYEQTGQPEWAAREREKSRGIPPLDCRSPSLECDFRAGRYAAVLATSAPLASAAGRYWLSRAAGELAREAFARLGDLPPSPEAMLLRVEVFRARRQPPGELIEELKGAVAAWPEDVRIRRELATLLLHVHNEEAARPVLEDLLKREPDSAELTLMLGQTFLDTQEPAKAVPLLARAVKLDPKLLPAQAALGRAHLEIGEAAQAIPHLEAALPTDTDGSVHYQLARAYRATGETDRASQALSKFQEIQRSAEAEARSLKEEFRIAPP
jgi:predicted Zn-dependent protease